MDENNAVVVILAVVMALWALGVMRRKRPFLSTKPSRRIPKHIRDAVIARDLRGKRFNGRKHHIDHIVPYSRDGECSVDNLRVVDKTTNLKKGNRLPTIGELW